MPIEDRMFNTQRRMVTVHPTSDAQGTPAEVDGDLVYEVLSGDGTVVTTDDTGSPDWVQGRSAWLVGGTSFDDFLTKISADADLGEGVETISDTVLLHIDHPKATSLGLTLGAAVPKP